MIAEPVMVQHLGVRSWGHQPGVLRTLRREPLLPLVRLLNGVLVDRLGTPRLTAPHADRRWSGGAVEALILAVPAETPLPFAAADFGPALLFTAPGRPVLWLWLSEASTALWPALVGPLLATVADPEDWSGRVPDRPVLRTSRPRAALHWGEGASWREGDRVLSFAAALAARPPEVFLPPPGRWAAVVPRWAAPLRDQICRDFAAQGARVVDQPEATVSAGTEPGT